MVYVDDMYKNPIGEFRGMKMSHLFADTTEELLEMVDKIGVQRKWIQDKGNMHEHFDIAMSKRKLAVQYGAKEVSMFDTLKIKQQIWAKLHPSLPPSNTTNEI